MQRKHMHSFLYFRSIVAAELAASLTPALTVVSAVPALAEPLPPPDDAVFVWEDDYVQVSIRPVERDPLTGPYAYGGVHRNVVIKDNGSWNEVRDWHIRYSLEGGTHVWTFGESEVPGDVESFTVESNPNEPLTDALEYLGWEAGRKISDKRRERLPWGRR